MERIGIFGGTFGPPHIGHREAARAAAAWLALDRVLLVPAYQAPNKQQGEALPTARQRLDMLRLAAQDAPELEVCDLELRREGVSYTVDTLLELRVRYPEAELVLLMGTDAFLRFENWRGMRTILDQASLGVFARGGRGDRERAAQARQRLEALGARIATVDNGVVDASSTNVRRMLAFGCAGDLIDPKVEAYIRENGLYDTAARWKCLPMEELERVVVRLLNPNRVAHVLGCRDTAVALARHWGADETDAARAGLLHDVTKALDGPLQLTLCDAYGRILSDFSRKYPKTLHALTGSMVAQRIFGEKEAVVEAIRHHTTGRADMTLLEKIIYVADYMEPNRDFPGVERLRELAFSDIDGALRLGLEMTLAHLKEQGSEVSPESREALAWLRKEESPLSLRDGAEAGPEGQQ